MRLEVLERLPVLKVINDDDDPFVSLPCYPFPGDEKPIAELMAEGAEAVASAIEIHENASMQAKKT